MTAKGDKPVTEAASEDDPNVIVVARALYDHAIKEAEEEVGKLPVPTSEIHLAFKEALSASDRGASIVIFALIDDLLMHFLRLQLNPKIKGGHKALFDGNGILASASSRITLAASLYWVDAGTYNDLNLHRQIRNTFAHRIQVKSFSDKPVIDYIASMSKIELRWISALRKSSAVNVAFKSEEDFDTRTRFFIMSLNLVKELCIQVSFFPVARSRRVSPHDIFRYSYENLPEQFQELYRVVARIYIELNAVNSD